MAVPNQRPPLTLTRAVGAALALAAVGAVVSLRRYAARRRLADRTGECADDASEWSADTLRSLDGDRFFRLCAAYYERRRFHVREARASTAGRDAVLYFGTLSHPVAIIRVIAGSAGAVDADAIRDLARVMSSHRVTKGIIHATAGYTDAALACAREHRIRLVSGEDLLRNVAGMPQAARASLSRAVRSDEASNDPQRELALD